MELIDDNVSFAGQEVVEARLGCFLAERLFEDPTQQLRHISQIVCVNPDGVEGARGNVELVSQANVDIGDLALGGGPARP